MIVANAFIVMYGEIKLVEDIHFADRKELNEWYDFHTKFASSPTTVILEGWFV